MTVTSPQTDRRQLRQLVLAALAEVAPEADYGALADHRRLRQELDLDSMDFLNVIIGLHRRTGLDIPEADYGELATLGSAVDYLARRSAATR